MLPGAVLLGEVLRAIESGLGADLSACRFRYVKFLAPVRPGDRLTITYAEGGNGAIRFACTVGGAVVLKGEAAREPARGAV